MEKSIYSIGDVVRLKRYTSNDDDFPIDDIQYVAAIDWIPNGITEGIIGIIDRINDLGYPEVKFNDGNIYTLFDGNLELAELGVLNVPDIISRFESSNKK